MPYYPFSVFSASPFLLILSSFTVSMINYVPPKTRSCPLGSHFWPTAVLCIALLFLLQRGVSAHCGYLLTSFSLTSSLTCTKSEVSLAPVPVGSGLGFPGSIKPLLDWDFTCLPAHLPFLLALCSVILQSHLPSKTTCFALAFPGALRSPLPSHLPEKLSFLSSPLRCDLKLRPPRQWEPFSLRPHHAFALYKHQHVYGCFSP